MCWQRQCISRNKETIDWNNLGIVNQGWLRTDGAISGMKKVIPAEIIRNLPKRYLEGKQSQR